MPQPKRWYSMQASTAGGQAVAEIRIYDEIGFWGMNAKDFMAELDEVSGAASRILVSINSPGGDVFDAFAIYNALRRHDLPVTARVDGVAASAASLILMAGDEIVMPENAMIMIHNPWTIAGGESKDLRKAADMMDRARDGIVAAYVGKSGKQTEEVVAMMDATTWLTALEAQALGFCDVIEEPVRVAASATARGLLAKHKDVPEDLLKMIDEGAGGDENTEDAQDGPGAQTQGAAGAPSPQAAQDRSSTPGANATADEGAAITRAVFAACREAKISHLAEAILATADYSSKDHALARVAQAEEIHGLCITARLSEKAADFVSAGMDVEQARARLFDAVTLRAAENISNLQRPQDDARASEGSSVTEIYAARAAALRKHRH